MSYNKDQPVWIFNFCLESELMDVKIPQEVAVNLLDQISDWADERGLQIGGGFRGPTKKETEPGPIFELDDEDSTGEDEGDLPSSGP